MRFISQDDPTCSNAQGQPLGSNLYAYCLNNPVNSSDPTGNASLTSIIKLAVYMAKIYSPFFRFADKMAKIMKMAAYINIKKAIFVAANAYLNSQDCPIAAALFNHFMWGNGASLSEQIMSKMKKRFKESSALTAQINEQLRNYKFNSVYGQIIDKEGKIFSVEFPKTDDELDLYYAIQHARIYLYGKKQSNGTWKLTVKLADKYDFTKWRIIGDGLNGANAANDLGHAMQILRMGTVFSWIVQFEKIYKPI